jgi:hypothetical protein
MRPATSTPPRRADRSGRGAGPAARAGGGAQRRADRAAQERGADRRGAGDGPGPGPSGRRRDPTTAAGAERAWLTVLEIAADDAEAYGALAALYRKDARWPDLRALLERQIEVAVEPAAKLVALGELTTLDEDVLGDPSQAVADYRRILELEPGHLPAYRALERLYADGESWADLEAVLGRRGGLGARGRAGRAALPPRRAARAPPGRSPRGRGPPRGGGRRAPEPRRRPRAPRGAARPARAAAAGGRDPRAALPARSPVARSGRGLADPARGGERARGRGAARSHRRPRGARARPRQGRVRDLGPGALRRSGRARAVAGAAPPGRDLRSLARRRRRLRAGRRRRRR